MPACLAGYVPIRQTENRTESQPRALFRPPVSEPNARDSRAIKYAVRGDADGVGETGFWSREPGSLALRELEALASARLAGLLALLFARIALDVTGLLERRTKLGIHLLQCAGD